MSPRGLEGIPAIRLSPNRRNRLAGGLRSRRLAGPTRGGLLRDLLPVLEEPLQTDVREGVLGHLLQHVERQRNDVRAELRGLDHVERMANRRDEDLTIPVVVPEDLDDLANHLHPLLALVVEASDERAHVLRTRLRRKNRLGRAEDEGGVDPDALL